jgi:hypothetical protein
MFVIKESSIRNHNNINKCIQYFKLNLYTSFLKASKPNVRYLTD